MAEWRANDPLQRWLRVISAVAFLGLVVLVVVDQGRAENLPLVALLSGALLLQLGYEVVVPGIARRVNGRAAMKEKKDADH